MNWKFTNQGKQVAFRTLEDGRIQSVLASSLPDDEIIESADPEPIPSVVTMRQARLALLQTGMLAQVNAAVAAADEATKITWEFSSEVQRNNALVATLAAALSLTDQQLDNLFALAATL
jgi:hypothetical protein